MNVTKFEDKAEQVHKAKRRIADAQAAYNEAVKEVDEARQYEQSAYREFMRYVREEAGLKSEYADA